MEKRAGGTRSRRVGFLVGIVGVLCLAFAAMAIANNLDRRTATNAAKFAAKRECQQTAGCTDYFVRGLHAVSQHKAVGKIIAQGARQGVQFQCTRQIVIKLDHFTGDITYATSARRCTTF
jgi:hypothetical protein